MKKIILLSAIYSLFFVSCTPQGDDVGAFGPTGTNGTIVGFAQSSQTTNFGTDQDDATLSVPVILVTYANETFPGDVTMQWAVDASSTAVEGVDYDLPASSTVVMPSGSTSVNINVGVHPSVFDPEAPRTLVLNMTAVSSNNAIVGFQYKQVVVTMQGVCVSNLDRNYSTSTLRIDNGWVYSHALEVFSRIEGSTYMTNYVGAYHSAGQTPGSSTNPSNPSTIALQGTSAGYTFTDICGKLKLETQNLASVYSNEVRQSADQFNSGSVNEDTGVVIIYYSIFFSGNTVERKFISTYTPL